MLANNINVIKDTGHFLHSGNRSTIKAELSNGNTKLRGEKKREDSCIYLDIKMFGDDAAEYCFAGTNRKGNAVINIHTI